MKKHKNDIYEDNQSEGGNESTVIAAATVLLLREREQLEVLMLQKTSKIEFGGMWVFRGGKIDSEDSSRTSGEKEAARYAAAPFSSPAASPASCFSCAGISPSS